MTCGAYLTDCDPTTSWILAVLENYLNVNHPRADSFPARVSVEVFGPTLFSTYFRFYPSSYTRTSYYLFSSHLVKNLDETVQRNGKQIPLLGNLTKEECMRKIYSTPYEYLELPRQRIRFTNDEITELRHRTCIVLLLSCPNSG